MNIAWLLEKIPLMSIYPVNMQLKMLPQEKIIKITLNVHNNSSDVASKKSIELALDLEDKIHFE